MADRINLIVNPSFKTNTTGWSAVGGSTSITRITTDAYFGTSCLEVTKAATSSAGVATSARVAVSSSTSYAVSAWVKVPAGQETSNLQIQVLWYTAVTGGSFISSTTSEIIEVSAGDDWVRLMDVVSSPSTAAGALVYVVQPSAGTASKKFLVDAVLLEASSYVGEYFDDVSQAVENYFVRRGLSAVKEPNLTGMELRADVAIGNLILNTIDEDGVVWVCTDIEGWWNHPEPEVEDIPRGYGDGSYQVRGRYMSRDITLSGVFLTPDKSYVANAREKLIKETDLVYVSGWLKTNESPTKASLVRLSGRPEITTVNARGRTEFTIGLRAADPLKYEWYHDDELGFRTTVISCENALVPGTGIGTITNTGNAYAPIVFEVRGTLVGPAVITNVTTGEFITVVEGIASDEVLEIDTKDHEVSLDGDPIGYRSYIDVLSDWILLAPGQNVFTFEDNGNANNASATLTVRYRSAWLG
jgi:hypothetical protein